MGYKHNISSKNVWDVFALFWNFVDISNSEGPAQQNNWGWFGERSVLQNRFSNIQTHEHSAQGPQNHPFAKNTIFSGSDLVAWLQAKLDIVDTQVSIMFNMVNMIINMIIIITMVNMIIQKTYNFDELGGKLHWNLLEALPSKYHLHICSHDSNILEISRRRSILPASSPAMDTFSQLKTTSSPSRMTQPVSTDFRLPWGNQICKHENNWQEWHANDFD